MTVRLTQGMVRRVHEDHPPGSQLYDEEVSGLRLVVGSKSSSYKFMGRINDGTARYMTITLGRADELALKTARAMAVDIKQKLARGEDPRKPKSTVPTLAEVLERYLAARANDLQPRTIHGYRDNLKPIMKDVGKLPMDKIDREMARSLHEKVTKKNGIYAANHAMRVLKLLYNDCARTFDLPPNPVSRAVRLHKEKVRDWAIAPADLPEFWRRLDGMQDRVRAACWLLMLTSGLRSSNARAVKWEHLCDEGTLLIPRAKSGRSFTLPLPRMMLQELERVKQETAPLCSPFVFPSITSGTGHIEKMGRTPRFPYAPHMMRHTYRTIALEVGIDFQSITMLMDHANTHVSYNYVTRAHLTGHLRECQERICARLVSFRGG